MILESFTLIIIYYKIWSFDGSTEYSSGTTANATTLCESVKVLPFTESFENATFPPQCWTTIRGTNNLGTSKDWIRATTNTYSSPGAAFVDYENVTGGLAEDWMVSPGILLPPSGTTTLSFYERQTYVSNYGSMYYLKVSTTSQDVRADFTDVMSYNETTFGTTYTQRSIDLSGKNGQVVYIAFVMTNDDGDSWYVDNVSVSSTSVFWTGATNSNWNTTTNWSSSIVPTGASNLVIPDVTNQPVINTGNSGLCNDITIHPEVVVTINPVAALTVNGTFTNNSGTSGLLIKSDASGTGSLIHSTANISGTFERFMNDADFTNWKDGWHLISSPVSAQAIAPNFTSPTATDYDFYTWYEAGNQWVNYKNTSNAPNWLTANNNSLNFQVGKGYMAAYNTEATKQFSGILNTSDVTISDLAISGGTNSSWHLLGNPFSAALTWDASSAWNMTNIAGVAKVWNEAIQSYIDLTSSPSSIIPSTNGFTVQVLSGTGGLAIPASKRVHSTQAFYKSAEQYIKLIAHNIELGNAQESNVIITPNATEGFDLMYDGEFLAGYGPQFYSLAGDSKLSTNSLPALPYSTGIPFVFMSGEANNFRIEVKGLETLDTPAWLFDKKTNTDYKLSENNAYTFSAKTNDDPNRFLLHFSGVGQNEQFEKDQVKAWFYEQHLFVTSQSELSQLELIDLQGRVLFSKKLYGKATHSLSFDYPTGCYIVRISDNKQLKAIKIVVY
jgi:hypothetical protein